MKFQRSVEAIRTKSTTEDKLRDFYARLNDQIKTRGVGPSRIHSVNEHGLAEGETKHGKVIGTSLSSLSVVSKSDSSTWVSIIESASATGSYTKPTVIFTGENLQGQWSPNDIPPWTYESTETGWSNSFVFRK